MTKQQAINNISAVLNMGGSVSFSYKKELVDWYEEADLGIYRGEVRSLQIFGPKVGSIEQYIDEVLTDKNKIWQFRYIMKESGELEFRDIKKEDVDRLSADYVNKQEALGKNGILEA